MTEMVIIDNSPLIGLTIKNALATLHVPDLELFEIVRHKSVLTLNELPDDQTDRSVCFYHLF
jgi:hypothetical protein